jgi:predicted glycosyltransferase
MKTGNLRIALYSHDTMGLGHTRRNLLIAKSFASALPHADVLMITGARESSSFAFPQRVDCLTLPSLHKGLDGNYQARSLNLALPHMIALRTSIIKAALDSFKPDVLIVDNVPRGAVRELEPILPELSGRTRCVLGLRDVLDDPATVRVEWRRLGNEEAICDYYGAVWVYGDRKVYDPVKAYGFSPEVAAKVRYAGYFDRCGTAAEAPAQPFALCLVGGGQDGARLAQAFAEARLPEGMSGVIVTGPFMPEEAKERLRQRASENPRLKLLDFVPEATALIGAAERVITMGGYNTVSEVLCYEKPALIVPRVRPRREQLVRAERLFELGLADLLHPDALSPDALGDWLRRPISFPGARRHIDFGGLARLPQLLDEVLDRVPVTPLPERYPLYAG